MSRHLLHLTHILHILERELASKERELSSLPKGSLYLKSRKNGNSLCWKQEASQSSTGERTEKILHEEDRSLAESIQRRHLLEKQIPIMQRNLDVFSDCITQYQVCCDQDIQKTLPPIYTTPLDYIGFLNRNASPSFSSQTFYPEGLIHKNSVGERFLSKSEVQISEILRSFDLNYCYEPRITLDDKILSPDFQIIHPVSGELLYIEYFGMVDNNDYGLRMLEKIRLYLDHGYTPGRNILFLFETPSSGMDLSAAYTLIQQFIS